MTIKSAILAVAAAASVASCANGGLIPSEYAYLNTTPEKLELWLEECGLNEKDLPRKQRFCELAVRSIDRTHADYAYVMGNLGNVSFRSGRWADADAAYSEAIKAGRGKHIYASRAEMRVKLGRFEDARRDFRAAYNETGQDRYLEDIQWLDYALEAAYSYEVFLTGFACREVQKDSFLYPASEISIHVIASDGFSSNAVALPRSRNAFPDVDPGHVQRLNERVFTADAFAPFTLSVQMFEVDDGGPLVDVAVMYGMMLATASAGGKGGGGRYLSGSVPTNMPEGASTPGSPSADPVQDAVAGALKSAFGTANDYMGGHDFMNMVATSVMSKNPGTEHGINYDFKSTHRRGGADCSAYFMVDQQKISDEQYVEAVNRIMGD